MHNLGYTPAKAGSSRVFLIEGGARPDNSPSFKSCLRALGISAGFGDVESIWCPNPDKYNDWVEVGEIQGAEERPTTGLQGRYAQDEESDLLRVGKLRCKVDVHVHFGACTDPGDFNTFTKAVVFELASFTNYSSDDLGALSSDEEASITESVDVSAKDVYEVLPLSFAERCAASVVAPIVDIVICDSPACGECEDESDGCQIQFAVTASSAGSPGTAPDLVWTDDRWTTCNRDDITSLLASETANALACLGDYVVVVSNDSNSLHYKTKVLILAGTAFNWIEEATGFVLGGEPRDIWAASVDLAFIVGDGGYIYSCADPAAGVTVLDAGVATTEDLYAVHAIDDDHAVAVGDNDAIVYTTDGEDRAIYSQGSQVQVTERAMAPPFLDIPAQVEIRPDHPSVFPDSQPMVRIASLRILLAILDNSVLLPILYRPLHVRRDAPPSPCHVHNNQICICPLADKLNAVWSIFNDGIVDPIEGQGCHVGLGNMHFHTTVCLAVKFTRCSLGIHNECPERDSYSSSK